MIVSDIVDKIKEHNIDKEKCTIILYTRYAVEILELDGNEPNWKKQEPDWEVLELHAFDGKKEYRFLASRHKDLEWVSEDSKQEEKDYYDDIMYIDAGEEKKSVMKVRNYIGYNDNGMIQIDDYRIIGIEKKAKEVQ